LLYSIEKQKGEVNMVTFDDVWSQLRANLKAGATIRNWTAFRGYLGDTMTVAGVREDRIEVDPPNAINIQAIPKDEFKKVWEVWSDYKRQKVRRYELRDMTRYSKYVISILHWSENV
jgi:hypothetical protein